MENLKSKSEQVLHFEIEELEERLENKWTDCAKDLNDEECEVNQK